MLTDLVHLSGYGDSRNEAKTPLPNEWCKENIKFIFKSKIHGQESSVIG